MALQRARRPAYPQSDVLSHLPVFAFTAQHRAQIQTGTLILSSMHAQVIDIVRRDGGYVLIDHHYREIGVQPSMKLRIKYPAVPVPLPPRYDPTVIPPESEYTGLSLHLRLALDYFAWADWKPKPRHFTICALLKRGIIQAAKHGDGRYRATPYGSALYRAYGRHDKEIQNG